MDFFARQQRVRRMSVRLVILFAVAVLGIVTTINLAVVLAFNAAHGTPQQLVGLIVVVSLAVLCGIAIAALVRMASLRGGGGRVAIEMGGVLVPANTTDPQLRRLRNVVEEIAIASGVTVPEIYILPNEDGINAFAAGWSTSDAAVAVTRGCLETLNRDELQGVIAHEFSHVVNGDMRLNIRLIGLLFGILFLTVIGRIMLQASFWGAGNRRGRSGNQNNPLPIIGIALVVAGFIGVLAGRLIQAAVSRQREYLADASAVQFTRQTAGIAGALKKIGAMEVGSKLSSPRVDEVGHMLFGSGKRLTSVFATHPPLLDRIKVLEPGFNPSELDQLARQYYAHPPSGLAEDAAKGLVGPAQAGGPAPAVGAAAAASPPVEALPEAHVGTPVQPAQVVAQVAAPTGGAYRRAAAILDRIPDEVMHRAHDPQSVVPLVLGLLLSDQDEVRAAQLGVLGQRHGQPLATATAAEGTALAGLHPLLRLPLAQVAFPALRQLPADQRATFLDAEYALIQADGRLDVFEYCLSRMIHQELTGAARPKEAARSGRLTLASNGDAVRLLLSVLAAAGNDDPAAAAAAFDVGARRLLPGQRAGYAPPAQGVVELERVWSTLDLLEPGQKSLLVQGCVEVIAADGVLTVDETELLRTVCALLHCPLPPVLGTPAEVP
jgi:Zn-dependent protease with chaperone function